MATETYAVTVSYGPEHAGSYTRLYASKLTGTPAVLPVAAVNYEKWALQSDGFFLVGDGLLDEKGKITFKWSDDSDHVPGRLQAAVNLVGGWRLTAPLNYGDPPAPPVPYGVKYTDTFDRADSATVGNGWTEDVTETQYRIQTNRLDRVTTLGPPGGSIWMASGDAVASGKTKLGLKLYDLKAAAVENLFQAGFLDAAAKITGSANGYIFRRYLGTVVYACRVVGAVITDFSPTLGVGLSENASFGTDVEIVVEQSGSDVNISLYSGGSLVGTRTDTTPGAAAGIFTTAYPSLRSNPHDWNGHSMDKLEVSY